MPSIQHTITRLGNGPTAVAWAPYAAPSGYHWDFVTYNGQSVTYNGQFIVALIQG